MHLNSHRGASAPGLAAPNAALKYEGPASGGKLGLQADQESTNSRHCASVAAAAREAAALIATLRAPSPAEVKAAIVGAACRGLIQPTVAHWLIQVLTLRHA